jgi:hypothetical protein
MAMEDGDHPEKPDANAGKKEKSIGNLDKSVKQLLGVPQKELEEERKPKDPAHTDR